MPHYLLQCNLCFHFNSHGLSDFYFVGYLNRVDYLNEAEELSPHLTHLMRQLLTEYDTKVEQKEIRTVEIL